MSDTISAKHERLVGAEWENVSPYGERWVLYLAGGEAVMVVFLGLDGWVYQPKDSFTLCSQLPLRSAEQARAVAEDLYVSNREQIEAALARQQAPPPVSPPNLSPWQRLKVMLGL